MSSKTLKAADTHKRIYQSAITLFESEGFEATTMRKIAAGAKMSLGATYYYFPSKEALVLEFYSRTTANSVAKVHDYNLKNRDFYDRLRFYLDYTFEQFAPYQEMVAALVKNGIDPRNQISPFGAETIELRSQSIDLIKACISDSRLSVAKNFKSHLPVFIWLYVMGMIFFWSFDYSAKQQRSTFLLDQSLKLLKLVLKLSSLPLFDKINAVAVLTINHLWPLEKIYENKN